MFWNYLKTALRNIKRQKGYAFINIFGLAVGIACCALIYMYVTHELRFDQYHKNHERIYRLVQSSNQDPDQRVAVTASGYAPALLAEFPEIDQVVRFFDMGAVLKYKEDIRSVSRFVYSDPSVFKVFDFHFIKGDPEKALDEPGSMVISDDAAQSLFGEEDPYGKDVILMRSNMKIVFHITGIYKRMPDNSHMRFDYLVPFGTIKMFMGEDALENFTNHNYFTYVMLNKGVPSNAILSKFPSFIQKYRGPEAAINETLILQPLTDIHLTTDIRFDRANTISTQTLVVFSSIAVFILLIASINFMNLSTARATLRTKEVVIRKVIGARRTHLIRQFYLETFFSGLMAVILALILLVLFTPKLSDLLGHDFPMNPFSDFKSLTALIGIGMVTGVLAGTYPALFLSMFSPVAVMKGFSHKGVKGRIFRKVLIVFQFGLAISLILAMTTVYNQLSYMKQKDLGFEKEQVVYIPITSRIRDRFDHFRNTLQSSPNIQSVSLVHSIPGFVGTSRGYMWPGGEAGEEEKGKGFYTMHVDPYTVKTLGLEIVSGRNFSSDISSDETYAYILNETAVKELGWEKPVGMPFRVWDREMGHVIGVVKDFHFKSLHQEIEPLVMAILYSWCGNAVIRISPENIPATLTSIEEQWKRMEPEMPYWYRFLDDSYDRLYRSEERMGRLFSYFTTLAVFICCLGLFGMVSFMADRRKKEIGIRKTLGAKTSQLLFLISKDFSKLVIIAFIVSAPIAYLVMDNWLEKFAYRISQSIWMFLLIGLCSLLLALITVSYQSIKAARTNPVDVLMYE